LPCLDLGQRGCYESLSGRSCAAEKIHLGCGGHPPMRVKTLILATSAAGALALSAGAASADPNGWYGAIDAGYHMAEAETSAGFDVEIDDDWAGFARLGYRFTPNWRVELEGGYRPGEIGEMAVGGVPAICNAIP